MIKFKNNYLTILMYLVWGLFIAFLISIVFVVRWYNSNLKPVNRQQTSEHSFDIARGASLDEIAKNLKAEDLIRDETVFKWYVRLNDKASDLQAGKFDLSASWYVEDIVKSLTSGIGAKVQVEIKPEWHLKEIQTHLVEQGFDANDVRIALQKEHYSDHQLIHEGIIPAGASLEGYLAPETFEVDQFNVESAKHVIRQSLDTFLNNLTPAIRQAILENQNFDSIHEAVILASIVEKEVHPKDRATVAQVFMKRLSSNMTLGSDVTFFYIADINGYDPDPDDPSPYNTRQHRGLPPGPISNVSASALQAVAFPSATDYLFFLTGDDHTVHFNDTHDEHLADRHRYCQKLCQLPASN